ncbi:hypothetical protein CRYUN_Cryun07bG0032100 [Craigia yunnanensis]
MANASLPSSQPPPSPPSISASHSESSATLPTALVPLSLGVLDNPEYIEKYKKYEADYTCRLMAKYFSKKNFYGGNIFFEKTTIDSETILSSRWPCTRSFPDPVHAFEDQSNGGSISELMAVAPASLFWIIRYEFDKQIFCHEAEKGMTNQTVHQVL